MVNMELQKITYLSESVKINNIFDTLAPLSEKLS